VIITGPKMMKKNCKKSKRFQKNPCDSKKIQKIQKDYKGIALNGKTRLKGFSP